MKALPPARLPGAQNWNPLSHKGREIRTQVKGRGSLSVFQRVSFLLCCFKQTLVPSAEFSVPSTAPHSPEAALKSLGVGREGVRSSKTGQTVTDLGAEVQD